MLGPDLDVRGGITSIERVMLENAPADIDIRHVATFAGENRLCRALSYLVSWLPFLRGCLSRKTDLVHVHFSQRGSTVRKLGMCAVCVMARKPFVLHANGSRYHQFFPKLPSGAQAIIRSVFRRCGAFIAVSREWCDFYHEQFRLRPGQAVLLHNPVQVPATVPDRAGRAEVRFVSFGRIGERKGQFDLIRAVAELPPDSRRRCRVLLAGDGEVEEAGKLARELGVNEHVEVRGWLEPADRDRALASADAFVLVSRNEGLPMALLEGMAWALPVVSTPVGGIAEVVRPGANGMLVSPGDVPAIADALRRLIEDEPLRLRMGAAARASIEPLRIERFMDRLREIYGDVLCAGVSTSL